MIRKIFKYVFVSFISILLLLGIFLLWIYLSIFSGPDPFEISDYHPFRSEKARIEYLAFEDEMAKTWPVISEERFVETSYGKTFMRISGASDAPPLFLLPGGGTNSLIWNTNIKALSEKFRTYAIDNIYDYGRSVYTKRMNNGKDFANWLNELSDSLSPGNKINLIGYSYGGWVASQYAVYYPERTNKLVLIAPAFTILPLAEEFILQMVKTIIPIRYFKSEVMYSVWKDLANKGDWGKEIVENRIDYYDIAFKSFKFKQPVNPTVLTDSELKELKMPILYLIGENEKEYNPNEAVSRLNSVNPAILTKIITETGHDLMFTHTKYVNQLLLDFFQE